jgi:hypothetical protein
MGFKGIMQITNRTVSFIEHQAVSDHVIFEDENGVEFIAEPGPVQKWLKLSEIKRPRHDRVKFLQNAERINNIQTPPEVMAEAYKHTQVNQRAVSPKPLKVVTQEGKLVDNK